MSNAEFRIFTNHQPWEWEYSALFAALTSPALRSWYVWSLSKPVSHQQQLHSPGNRILFVLMLFWRRCWAVSSGSHRFRDVEKDEEKQNFTCSLQLILFYPVFPVGRWQFRHFSPPFPPLFCWGHLSPSFSTFREPKLQHKHPCLSLEGLDQQVRSGRADRGCSGGLSCPSLQSTGGRHRTHLDCPLDHWRQRVPPIPVIAFNITPSFVPVTHPVSRNTHCPSLPGLD